MTGKVEGAADGPAAAELRAAVVLRLLRGKQGFSGPFTRAVDAIEKVGGKSRIQQLLGEIEPEVIAFLTLRTFVASIIRSSGPKKTVHEVRHPSVPSLARKIGRVLVEEVAVKKLERKAQARRRKRVLTPRAQAAEHMPTDLSAEHEGEGVTDPLQQLRIARWLKRSKEKEKRKAGAIKIHSALTAARKTETKWSENKRFHLGLDMIALFREKTRLFRTKLEIRPRDPELDEFAEGEDVESEELKTENVVKPSKWFWRCVDQQKEYLSELSKDFFEPLPEIPQPWSATRGGGYERAIPLDLLKRRQKNKLVEAFDAALAKTDLSSVYQGVNTLQGTAWTIDRRVFGFIRQILALDPDGKHLVRHRPDAEIAPGRNWQWVFELSEAQPFYFAYQLDYRGRAYPLGSWLQPQGGDHARALLRFAEGKVITPSGKRWLAVHGANLMKRERAGSLTTDEKVASIETVSQDICASARNPLEHTFWLEKAQDGDVFMFLAFCQEWTDCIEAEKQGVPFYSHLPVAMDGSCNGFQHFAAMLRDRNLAQWTNLAACPKPADLYSAVAQWVGDAIRNDSTLCEATQTRYIAIVERKLAKGVVMIVPYGATMHGIRREIRKYILKYRKKRNWDINFDVSTDEGLKNLRIASVILARHFSKVIAENLPNAWRVRQWLQKCSRAVTQRDIPMLWISPIGLPVLQSLFAFDSIEIQSRTVGRARIKCHLTTYEDEVDVGDQSRASSPNFVHALDSSHMLRTAIAAGGKGITSLRMVHDSFATHASDAGLLAEVLRDEFCRLYEDDIIARHQQWVRAIVRCDVDSLTPRSMAELLKSWLHCRKASLHRGPRPPERGDFDIREVRKSQYFFC